jgi:MFS family permease
MIVFLQYPITRFLDRYKLTSSLIVGSLLYAIGFAAVGISGGFWSLFACMFIITIGEIVFSPPSMSIVSQMASSGSRGRYMNLSMVLTGFGWSLGPMIGGALMDMYTDNIVIMWAAIGVLGIIGMLGFVWLRLFIRKDIDSPGFEEKPEPVAVKVAVRR